MDISSFSALFREIFLKTFPEYDTPLVTEKFFLLTNALCAANEKMDLTAVTDPEQIILRHYADCAYLAPLPPKNAVVADIGAGAGFPTLPLAILRPDLTVVAVDSTEKRMDYVAKTASALGLQVQTVVGRAEELGRDPEWREKFDFVTARAVARLDVLCELCLPLCRIGGTFCAMKAVDGPQEAQESRNAMEILGGSSPRLVQYDLPGLSDGAEKRCLVICDKDAPTPGKYPRRFARIRKDPLQ